MNIRGSQYFQQEKLLFNNTIIKEETQDRYITNKEETFNDYE